MVQVIAKVHVFYPQDLGIVVRVPLLSSTIVVLVRLLEIKGVLILVLLEAGDANAILNDKAVREELLRLNPYNRSSLKILLL